jgi:hypothetical protein
MTSIPPAQTDDAGPSGLVPADPEATIADLRRQLRRERERAINATDRVLGAQAEAAQARAEIKELQYRLHVREAELVQARELVEHREPVGRGAGEALPAALAVARARLGRLARLARRR